jgi:hypothetical protein
MGTVVLARFISCEENEVLQVQSLQLSALYLFHVGAITLKMFPLSGAGTS